MWDNIEKDSQVENAVKFSKEFEPEKDKNYRWIYDHAIKQYDRVDCTLKILDSKADNMIKYLAPSSGILGLAITIITSNNKCFWFGIIGIMGIFLIITSIIFAALSLYPVKHFLFPSVKNAFQAAKYYENDELASASFATGIGIAIENNMVINEYKARLIKYAYCIFIIAIIWLFIVIPLLFLIIQNHFCLCSV